MERLKASMIESSGQCFTVNSFIPSTLVDADILEVGSTAARIQPYFLLASRLLMNEISLISVVFR